MLVVIFIKVIKAPRFAFWVPFHHIFLKTFKLFRRSGS